MPNPHFQFKQFTIQQEACAMKVGTDGVLLGTWTNCNRASRILDIGTGTGLIALMLAQRTNAQIDGLEIDELAAIQAAQNVAASPWPKQINITNSSFQVYAKQCKEQYDLIVTNPPYFENSLKSPIESRSSARHTDSLSALDIIDGSKKLLGNGGSLSLILPFKEGMDFIAKAAEKGMFCERKTAVIPRTGSAAKRLLLAFGFNACVCEESELVIETDARHVYSEAYKELTKEYYLKF